jgi:hypothetical protein
MSELNIFCKENTHTHTHTHTCTHALANTFMHAHTHTHAQAHTRTHAHTHNMYVCVYLFVCIYLCLSFFLWMLYFLVGMHTRVCVCVFASCSHLLHTHLSVRTHICFVLFFVCYMCLDVCIRPSKCNNTHMQMCVCILQTHRNLYMFCHRCSYDSKENTGYEPCLNGG